MQMNSQLEGCVAIVTGAGRGIGETIARLLAERGAAVMLTDIDAYEAERAADELARAGYQALSCYHDVGSENDWARGIARTLEGFGKLDLLVNNAGIADVAPFEDIDPEAFDRVIRVNVRGTFLGCKMVQPAMVAAGGGAIVNMSSVSGVIANMPGAGAYITSKGAVRLMTKAAAVDYAKYRIRVNSVHPGTVSTPMTTRYVEAHPDIGSHMIARTPLGRAAEPIEIARAVAYLLSEEASYMTGSEVAVDGGWAAC